MGGDVMTAGRRFILDGSASLYPTEVGGKLVGGSPLTLFTLTAAGTRLIESIRRGEAARPSTLLDRLLDTGTIHPLPPTLTEAVGDELPRQVTVIIPAFNPDRGALARLVQAVASCAAVVIVDDASSPAITAIDGASIIRLTTNGGPGPARQAGLAAVATPYVLFVDADVELSDDWSLLGGHFDDPSVGAIAPRVRSKGTASLLERYETVSSPLDLGDQAARVAPGTRVSYLPSAALLCRTEALRANGGFDDLRFGEDVDLIWRLVASGQRVRYEPAVQVHHRPRSSWRALLRQRFNYGTSAAVLAQRHPRQLAPLRINQWSAAAWAAVMLGHPLIGAAAAAGSTAMLAQRLGNDRPARRLALRLAGLGNLYAGRSIASTATRAWWPLWLVAAVCSRRARRWALLAVAVNGGFAWREARPAIDPARFTLLRTADDAAYGAGLWAGCWRQRSADALLPSWPSGRYG